MLCCHLSAVICIHNVFVCVFLVSPCVRAFVQFLKTMPAQHTHADAATDLVGVGDKRTFLGPK